MRIYPATHYTMGGLWVDYNLQTTIPGLFALGEANFSDHGANRLGASALMQGLADGYFVGPSTVAGYLAGWLGTDAAVDRRTVLRGISRRGHRSASSELMAVKGTHSVDHYHRELGKIVWDYCGMSRNAGRPDEGARRRSPRCARSSGPTSRSPATPRAVNQSLEKALRVADFMEMAELKVRDALHREESCGGHFREESQTEEGEA